MEEREKEEEQQQPTAAAPELRPRAHISPFFCLSSTIFVYALFSLFFLLKSSSWAKSFRIAMRGASAGGYCPTQYQLPGASHFRFAGSATQSLDSWETFRILNI